MAWTSANREHHDKQRQTNDLCPRNRLARRSEGQENLLICLLKMAGECHRQALQVRTRTLGKVPGDPEVQTSSSAMEVDQAQETTVGDHRHSHRIQIHRPCPI